MTSKSKLNVIEAPNFHHLVSFTLWLTWNMDSISIWIWLVRNTTLVQDGCRHHAKHTLETSKSNKMSQKHHIFTIWSAFQNLEIMIDLSHGAKLSFPLKIQDGWGMDKIDIVRVGFKISTTCHSTTKLSAVVLLKCYPAITVIIVKVYMQLE